MLSRSEHVHVCTLELERIIEYSLLGCGIMQLRKCFYTLYLISVPSRLTKYAKSNHYLHLTSAASAEWLIDSSKITELVSIPFVHET